jgi:hypothetical protein
MLLPLLAALLGCGSPETSICQDLCVELVSNCEYAAYPSLESCLQGCGYSASEGADVDAQAECILAAECDTFAIIECEHQYGVEAATGTPTTAE